MTEALSTDTVSTELLVEDLGQPHLFDITPGATAGLRLAVLDVVDDVDVGDRASAACCLNMKCKTAAGRALDLFADEFHHFSAVGRPILFRLAFKLGPINTSRVARSKASVCQSIRISLA